MNKIEIIVHGLAGVERKLSAPISDGELAAFNATEADDVWKALGIHATTVAPQQGDAPTE